MSSNRILSAIGMTAILLTAGAGDAAAQSFRRIADTSTPPPMRPEIQPCSAGAMGAECGLWFSPEDLTFSGFGLPSAGGPIAFRAEARDADGIDRTRGLYAYFLDGNFFRAVDNHVTSPPLDGDVEERYRTFSNPSADADPCSGAVLFAADHTRVGPVNRRGSLYASEPAGSPPPLALLEDDVFDSPANPGLGPNVFGVVSAHLGILVHFARRIHRARSIISGSIPLCPSVEV
jgi:hypothetical protein